MVSDLGQIAGTYDRVAESYAAVLVGSMDDRPLERALVAAFAELAGPLGPVVDVGCGTGRLSGLLPRGVGIDPSAGMLAVARRDHPARPFARGALPDLPVRSGSAGGVLGWFGFVHTPHEGLPAVFAEFRRVLVPGGVALLGFHVGDEVRHLTAAYGHAVDLTTYWRRPAAIEDAVRAAGLALLATTVAQPQGQERAGGGFVLAQRTA